MRSIDYATQASCCFPFDYAERHHDAAKTETTWYGYAVHVIVGYLEYVPLLNYIVALFDYIIGSQACSLSPAVPANILQFSSHFLNSDIQLIAKKSIGLRHVSSPEAAAEEQRQGVSSGCAFNLTFQKSEHDYETGFENLPRELESNLPESQRLQKLDA
jgi:hypothetical protein